MCLFISIERGWRIRGSNLFGVRFSSPVQTGPGADPSFYAIGTGFWQGQSGQGVALTIHHHLALRLKKKVVV